MAKLIQGDCLDVLKTLDADSVDALVSDPPAGISFMGKDWDHNRGGRDGWVRWLTQIMQECMRVMKPGAHGLVWAIPKTSHWTATALEDSGFEIRDVITHLFGSGFPKSLDVSKAIDKAAGAEREIVGKSNRHTSHGNKFGDGNFADSDDCFITKPATDAAKDWQGWGTALKPASEHWILIRKPISEKTVAANVLKWGTGALNIDGCRIETKDRLSFGSRQIGDGNKYNPISPDRMTPGEQNPQGRFPANLVLSCSDTCTEDAHDMFECPVYLLDEQSGISVSRPHKNKLARPSGNFNASTGEAFSPHSDSGGASRFFYCAKASKKDKNDGCDLSQSKAIGVRPKSGDPTGKFPDHDQRERVGNFHPTVKSTKLMTYLIRMITPPNGIVLDPFMGSGSTGVAAIKEAFQFIGIESDINYFDISTKRIEHAEQK